MIYTFKITKYLYKVISVYCIKFHDRSSIQVLSLYHFATGTFFLGNLTLSTKVISWHSKLPSVLTNLCIKHESLLIVLIEFILIRFICPSDFGMHPQLSVKSALIKGERFTSIQWVPSTRGWWLKHRKQGNIHLNFSWSLKEFFRHSLVRTTSISDVQSSILRREHFG